MSDSGKEKNNGMVEITLRTIGPSPPSRLSAPSPVKSLANWKHEACFPRELLDDSTNGDDSVVQLHDGETLIVAVKPKPPAKHIRENMDDDDDDDEDLKFHLPESTSRWKKRLFFILRNKLKFPDIFFMAIFSLSLKIWVAILVWFILAHVAHRSGIGPLYILGTGFVIIFYNLGHRQPGDVSAYSVFNEDFRELPGTLNADRLDRDIRNGQY